MQIIIISVLQELDPRPQTDGESGQDSYRNSHQEHNGYIFIQNIGYRLTPTVWILWISCVTMIWGVIDR